MRYPINTINQGVTSERRRLAGEAGAAILAFGLNSECLLIEKCKQKILLEIKLLFLVL
jgi:hypothetical protein